MTSEQLETTGIRPPADYPYPEWAAEDDETFYVPEQLRADYATFGPRPAMEAQYWREGAEYVTTHRFEEAIARADAAGRDPDGYARVEDFLRVDPEDFIHQRGVGDTTEFTVQSTTRLSGREGFPQWLHLARLEIAVMRQRQRDFYATMRGTRSA